MSFDCSKVVPKKCHGDCCRFVPIPKALWNDQKGKVVRKVMYLFNYDDNNVMPITRDLSCPFLGEDFRCAIYTARPWICRTYGIGGHDCLSCPYLKPNGNKRDKKDRDRLVEQNNNNLAEIAANINKVGKMISQGKSIEEVEKVMGKPKQNAEELKKIAAILVKKGVVNENNIPR